MTTSTDKKPPILTHKHYREPSVFTPASLLREARRQKGAEGATAPSVCLLDPDGDIVRMLRAENRARLHHGWVCYHTELWVFEIGQLELGIIGCAVGASFAVLVAEELFESGCELLISITSAGEITPIATPPNFILIDRALRDEGVSYHYMPPSDWSNAPNHLLKHLTELAVVTPALVFGSTWTTDAPFRETETSIAFAKARGILAVEMEAAGLYAFASARNRDVICLAHVTNQMGRIEGDFEKGEANGAADALHVVAHVAGMLGWDISE
jgi:uridine phosphorylase